jgi:outer membrane protein assembly factor BamB
MPHPGTPRALLLALILCSPVFAGDWPQWRGPNLNGFTDAAGLPDKLDPATNLVWSMPLPGQVSASPVVAGGKVFVSTIDDNQKLLAICLDDQTGKPLWQKQIGSAFDSNERNNQGSPSPVTDGKNVWFYFGSGDLAAFDAAGKPLWSRNIQKDYGEFQIKWLYASSPLLFDGKLYVQVLHSGDDSYLLAIDPLTGKTLWKQARTNDAIAESRESYATPIPASPNGKPEVVLIGGDAVTAHDAETGRELWRVTGYNARKNAQWRSIASVLPIDGMIIACAPQRGPVLGIQDGPDTASARVAWSTQQITSDVCVPLAMDHSAYVLLGERRKLVCIDPTTGKQKWSGSLPSDSVFRASPTGADGKIYCISESGDAFVLAADHFQILSQTSLGGRPCHASIAVSDGRVFVRTGDKIYAFARK